MIAVSVTPAPDSEAGVTQTAIMNTNLNFIPRPVAR